MTIATTSNQISYAGDGVSLAFAFPYPFITTADLKVYLAGVLQTTGYSVAGVAPSGGSGTFSTGTVTFTVAPAAAAVVLIYCDPDLLQSTSLPPNDPFAAKSVEKALDKLTLLIQRIVSKFGNALTFPLGDTTSGVLPSATARASLLLGFDSTGAPVTYVPVSGSAADVLLQLIDATVTKGDALVTVKSTLTNAVATTQHQVNEERVSVFRFLTAAQIADIVTNAGIVNCQTNLQNAVTSITTAGKRPYFPAGTYLFDLLTFALDCTVETEGVSTIFKRTTVAKDTAHVLIQANIVFGDVRGIGNIANDTPAGQSACFIQVTPGAVDLDLVEFGVIKCSGYHGDGLYIDGRPATKIKKARWRYVDASNMWRSAVSIIGATDVEFGGVNGNNTCAYSAMDIEPNAGVSQTTDRVRGTFVIGGRFFVQGNATIAVGDVDLGFYQVDYTQMTNTTPASTLYDSTSSLTRGQNFGRVRIGYVSDANATVQPHDWHSGSVLGILQFDRYDSANYNTEATIKALIRGDGCSEVRIGSGNLTPATADRYILKSAATTRYRLGYLGKLKSTGAVAASGTESIFENLDIACAANDAFISITKSVATRCKVTAALRIVNACSDFTFRGGEYTYSGGTFDAGGSVRLGFDHITSNGVAYVDETAITYSASMAVVAPLARTFVITATSGVAFTINSPSEGYIGQLISIKVKNTSGGALGVATWGAAFRLGAWTQPANGFHRTITYEYDGTSWCEQSRTATDIPN